MARKIHLDRPTKRQRVRAGRRRRVSVPTPLTASPVTPGTLSESTVRQFAGTFPGATLFPGATTFPGRGTTITETTITPRTLTGAPA